MSGAWRWLLRGVVALALIAFGAWLVFPKGDGLQTMCAHTPFYPDPLVDLREAERQPYQRTWSTPLNLRPGESRQVTLLFDLRGVPPTTPVNVVGVSRRWLNTGIGELSARPWGPSGKGQREQHGQSSAGVPKAALQPHGARPRRRAAAIASPTVSSRHGEREGPVDQLIGSVQGEEHGHSFGGWRVLFPAPERACSTSPPGSTSTQGSPRKRD